MLGLAKLIATDNQRSVERELVILKDFPDWTAAASSKVNSMRVAALCLEDRCAMNHSFHRMQVACWGKTGVSAGELSQEKS